MRLQKRTMLGNKVVKRTKSRGFLFALAVVSLLAAFSLIHQPDLNQVSAQSKPDEPELRIEMVNGFEAVAGEVIVKMSGKDLAMNLDRVKLFADTPEHRQLGADELRLFRLQSRSRSVADLLRQLEGLEGVEYVEPNYIVRHTLTPNDPSFGQLWGLNNTGQVVGGTAGIPGADISAVQAWDVSTGSTSIVVGVIDTGVDFNHPDLSANMWSAPSSFTVTLGGQSITCPAGSRGFNAVNNTCIPMDDNNHGTHCSGTIGARGNNGQGVVGVNWTTRIMGLKFLTASGSGNTADAIECIDFAIQAKNAFSGSNGANVRVLSNSWGGGGFSQALLDAINRANTNNMLFVAAAGNNGSNNDVTPHYPSSYNAANVLAVASTTNRDARSSFSNFGATSVDLGAPGSAILSTVRNNAYASFSGTSMATPHVSGAAALVLSACSLTTAALKANLMNNVDPISALSGITVTGGRLNVDAAIRACSGGGGGNPVTIFFDDFETNQGWTTNPNGTDTATTGQWVRANPESTNSSGAKQLGTTVSGVNDLVTGAPAGASAGANDIDGGTTSIQSPLITLSGGTTFTLSFAYYLAHGTNSSTADFFRITIVSGSTTTVVFQELGGTEDDDAIWQAATVNLSAFAGQTVRIRIEAADAATASLVEAAVNDLRITRP